MIIKHITIQKFGSVQFYDTALTPGLNLIDTRCEGEIFAAISLLLCSKLPQGVPPVWIRPTTRLTAQVLMDACAFTVCAEPKADQLKLSATDAAGNDVTNHYRYMLHHCPEQDAMERFDGQDATLPMRLCWYRNCAEAPENVSEQSASLVNTKAFRSYLFRYIKAFRPEPINCKKDYQTEISQQGKFELVYPGVSGAVNLSETEEKLFRYICFLNIAEFWTDVEKIRDLHHEKKPLVIRNFLEFLDETTDIRALIDRTIRLRRQVIILTPPLGEETKKKWTGKDGFDGLLFKLGH